MTQVALLPAGGRRATVQDQTAIVPRPVAECGEAAAWRYIEFFTVNIRNPNTCRAYGRACRRFLAWCEKRGLVLTGIRRATLPPMSRCWAER